MRFKEIISEESYSHAVEVDWNKLKAALTVMASDLDFKGVKPVDAIMFLGVIGDPKASVYDVKLKRPVRVGTMTPKAMANLGGANTLSQGKTAGEYNSSNRSEWSDIDIVINPEYWDPAMNAGSQTPRVLAHEFRHRGLDIMRFQKELHNRIPANIKKYFDHNDNPDPESTADQFDHYVMYSIEGNYGATLYTTPECKKRAQQMYYQLEGIAKEYISTLKVPSGGWNALQKDIDTKTPNNMDIKITPGANGIPVIKGIVDKVGDNVSQDIDKIKSAVTTPPVATQSPKVSDDPTAELPNPRPTEKNTDYKGSAGSQQLQKLNPEIKNVNVIYSGQKIKLPDGSVYVVKKGDTLDQIAARTIKEDQLSRIKQLAGLGP